MSIKKFQLKQETKKWGTPAVNEDIEPVSLDEGARVALEEAENAPWYAWIVILAILLAIFAGGYWLGARAVKNEVLDVIILNNQAKPTEHGLCVTFPKSGEWCREVP